MSQVLLKAGKWVKVRFQSIVRGLRHNLSVVVDFQEIEEDLFGGKSKKKEERSDGAKKTKKATKTVTDEDLFGDSGSIFETKPKDKKKKKAENAGKDIFNSKDDGK